jgi:hypothetical protein
MKSATSMRIRLPRLFTRHTGSLLVFLPVLVGMACNLTGLLTPTQSPPVPQATEPPAAQAAPPEDILNTIINFEVQVPPDTPLDQPIYLTVLDEVTGLALNAERYEMEVVEDFVYAVDLTLPVGS